MLWAEFGWHTFATLVPAFVPGIVFDEGYFAWEAAARANVVRGIVTEVPQESSLIDVVCAWLIGGFHSYNSSV
jgi:hypothetical protein